MQASNSIINLDILPNNAQLTLKELASSPSKNKRGYTRLSESHIRRLEAAGLFPKSRQITGTRPVCQPKHEPTDFEITYKSGCLGERNAKANHSS